jgi:uncharacterized BrkB/YihY/UPF0761 family membrane protein
MGPPGWIVGPAVAMAVLFIAMRSPLFALGIVGLLLAPALAMWAGTAAASMVGSRSRINTAVVVALTLLVFVMYVRMLQSQPPPRGASYFGATIAAPGPATSGSTVPPP